MFEMARQLMETLKDAVEALTRTVHDARAGAATIAGALPGALRQGGLGLVELVPRAVEHVADTMLQCCSILERCCGSCCRACSRPFMGFAAFVVLFAGAIVIIVMTTHWVIGTCVLLISLLLLRLAMSSAPRDGGGNRPLDQVVVVVDAGDHKEEETRQPDPMIADPTASAPAPAGGGAPVVGVIPAPPAPAVRGMCALLVSRRII